MKLRNKQTGEIGWLYCDHISVPKKMTVFSEDKDLSAKHWDYTSLSELNEEWEDYEEPKEWWYLDVDGEVCSLSDEDDMTKDMKYIGNYFETKEEAERAVEKLKALKRLKDEGMIKYSFHKEKTGIDLDFYTLTILAPRDKDSLDLLFGGEDE